MPLQAGSLSLCGCDRREGWVRAHWRPHEEGLVVIDVVQGHLQRLHGLIWHWLAQVAGHQDELEVEEQSEDETEGPRRALPKSQVTTLKDILGGEVAALRPEESSSWPRPLSRAPPPYAVHRLLLAVQALRGLDKAADWVNGEVLPVPIARRLQEAVAHRPIEALILVCGIDLVHVGAQRDLLRGGGGGKRGRLLGRLMELSFFLLL